MELKQLEYFLAVSKLKSFTRAAEKFYISQPSVTLAIRRLEEELGIILFERNKKQAILTPEGEIFYNHITIVMDDVFKATQIAAELKNLNSGIINLGISAITGLSAASFFLSKFRTIYPSLKINFVEENSSDVKKMLLEDYIDLGLVIIEDDMESLDYVNLGNQEMVVYLPNYHPLKMTDSIALSKLKNECFIMPKENCSMCNFLKEHLAKRNFMPHVGFETNYTQMIKHLIISGSGAAILPKGTFESGALHAVSLSPKLEMAAGVAKKKNKHLSNAAWTLYKFLKNSTSP